MWAQDIMLILYSKHDEARRRTQPLWNIDTAFTRCVSIFADDILLSTLILYYLSWAVTVILSSFSPWAGEKGRIRRRIRYSRPDLIESRRSAGTCGCRYTKKDQGLGHVDIASLLALIRPLYELLTRSQRPGDAETSSTFRSNPPRVTLSLETHASAAALLFLFRSPTRPPKPDGFWVSSFE